MMWNAAGTAQGIKVSSSSLPTIRMVPNTKQRIFVVKSNQGNRLIQNVKYHDSRLAFTPEPETEDTALNAEIDRLMSLPSNLAANDADSDENKAIKSLLEDVIQGVLEKEQLHGWGRSYYPPAYSSQTVGLINRRFCTYRPMEDNLVQHAERLRTEINKRRHRIEIECANDLGLIAPWTRKRFRKVKPEDEQQESVEFDRQHEVEHYEQRLHSQPTPGYYKPESQIADNYQRFPGSETADTSANARSTDENSACPVCERPCNYRLFCICCESCRRRFHGKCVKMTEKRAKKREAPWICHDCSAVQTTALPKEELLCVCKRPYNATEFYVGCDGGCENWYHPACVGTSQAAIERIEGAAYVCPMCRAG